MILLIRDIEEEEDGQEGPHNIVVGIREDHMTHLIVLALKQIPDIRPHFHPLRLMKPVFLVPRLQNLWTRQDLLLRLVLLRGGGHNNTSKSAFNKTIDRTSLQPEAAYHPMALKELPLILLNPLCQILQFQCRQHYIVFLPVLEH